MTLQPFYSFTTKTDNNTTHFEKEKKVFKIIVIGDSNVGKTCLTYRFCKGVYLDNPKATVGVDFRERVLVIGGEEIKLQIWDTAGQERYQSMAHNYYRNTHAVVIVYDVTNKLTFQGVSVWLEQCEQHDLTSQIPRILVGNKCDCVGSSVVSTNEAQHLADSHNMPLFETSALSESEGSNIEAIFVTLAHKLVKQQPLMIMKQQSLKVAPVGYENMQRANVSGVITVGYENMQRAVSGANVSGAITYPDPSCYYC